MRIGSRRYAGRAGAEECHVSNRLGGICRCLEASRIQFSLEQELFSFAALFEGLYVQAESGVYCVRAGGPAEIRGVEDPRRIWDGSYEGHGPEARHKGLPFDLMVRWGEKTRGSLEGGIVFIGRSRAARRGTWGAVGQLA